jgi:hypothetical protein
LRDFSPARPAVSVGGSTKEGSNEQAASFLAGAAMLAVFIAAGLAKFGATVAKIVRLRLAC